MRERGSALLEEAAERSRRNIVAGRLKANLLWFAQAAIATSLAWIIAKEGFGHPRPIFTPAVALIGVSATLGQRRRYATEMVIGVALGIGIADALVVAIGDGPIQVGAVVAGAMAVAGGRRRRRDPRKRGRGVRPARRERSAAGKRPFGRAVPRLAPSAASSP